MAKLIGTAGHVDHGKTTLIKALTGIDADRLPEEKARPLIIPSPMRKRRTKSPSSIGRMRRKRRSC